MEKGNNSKDDPEQMKLTEMRDLLLSILEPEDDKKIPTNELKTKDNVEEIKKNLKNLVEEYPEYLESGKDYYDDNWVDAAAEDPKLFQKMWDNIQLKLKKVLFIEFSK